MILTDNEVKKIIVCYHKVIQEISEQGLSLDEFSLDDLVYETIEKLEG